MNEKVEIESTKKNQIETNLEMKSLGAQFGTTEASFTIIIKQMEEGIPVTENTMYIDMLFKKKRKKLKYP